MESVIRSGSGDQPPSGRRGRSGSGRKRRRSWTNQAQPPIGQQPPLPTARYEAPREEPLTSAIPTASPYPTEDQRRTQPVRREPRNWRDVPPPRRQLPPEPPRPRPEPRQETRREEYPAETYGPDGYAADFPPDARDTQPAQRDERPASAPQYPKKLTVTRVAAMRGRQLTGRAVSAFRRAANADGADKSGLTALTYATMLNYASDAAMAVALANTLFFSAASTDSSKSKVALYLLITVAPFALVAPVIGPALDRIQRGRRLAMCAASAGQALMCLMMATNFDTWLLYPAALGKMVLSKSFTVLKAAVTPRVVPPDITLAKTNARLTVFGLAAGAVFGAVATLFLQVLDSPGALWFTAAICVVGAVQAMRIPAWVEVTEGEVPASLSANPEKTRRQPMGRHVVVALSANATLRLLTGFLMMFAAFAVREQTEGDAFKQLLLLGVIAGAAGVGSFAGNGIGARMHLGHPEQVVIGCIVGSLAATVVAALMEGVGTAAIVALVGATASALAKNSLDAVIQDDLPEESRASAFGRSETVLQLAWVFGGAIGILLPAIWWLGFLVISVLLAVGLVQTLLTRRGASLLPWFGGDRPVRPWRTGGQQRAYTPSPAPEAAFREGPPAEPEQRT
ncbi:MAG TPA: MFS transporter [Actinophytocola sp.]|nr:MFS transporter [Actinophytocola sp.]